MIITRKEYEEKIEMLKEGKLSKREELKYSNPCSISGDPDKVRVGESFDEDLGHYVNIYN